MEKKGVIPYFFIPMLFFSLMVSPSISKVSAIKDTLIVQITDDMMHIDNRYRRYTSDIDLLVGMQWQGRLLRNSPGETVMYFPAAVENLTQTGDATDPKFTFVLREGLTFHDGSALTARDVKYSFAANHAVLLGLGVESDPPFFHNLSEALSRTMDMFNITFPVDDPNGDGLEFQIGPINPSKSWFPDQTFLFNTLTARSDFILVPEGSQGSYDDDQATCEAKIAEFQQNSISSGPYKLIENITGDYVLLELFDDWFGWGSTFTDSYGNELAFPSVDKAFRYIKFRIIPESTKAIGELKRSGIDVTTSQYASREELEEIDALKDFEGFTVEALRSGVLELNAEGNWPKVYGGPGNYPLTELWFRKALVHAINRTNIIDNTMSGLGGIREDFYPEWILDKYPSINTSDYYGFTSDPDKASQLLEDNGYPKLGFVNDPDNRFGYGPYLNETAVGGVEHTRGHVFVIVADNSEPWKVQQAIAVQNDLADVGIVTELRLLDKTCYLDAIQEDFDPGWRYNTSYCALKEPDPEFQGPVWDFAISERDYLYENPIEYVRCASYIYWYFFGGGNAIFSKEFELELARMLGGSGYLEITHPNFPVPEWSAFDAQFLKGAEEAGRIFTNEVLSHIPFAWDLDTYTINSHLNNFQPNRNGEIFLAYTYWTPPPRKSTGWPLPPLLSSFMVSILIRRKRKGRIKG